MGVDQNRFWHMTTGEIIQLYYWHLADQIKRGG
nr:MAG TPA: hypothetical protein [Caudoviricetes sp.]